MTALMGVMKDHVTMCVVLINRHLQKIVSLAAGVMDVYVLKCIINVQVNVYQSLNYVTVFQTALMGLMKEGVLVIHIHLN